MKISNLLAFLLIFCTLKAQSQGTFLFSNSLRPTHVGSIDGPLAGPEFWGQMLAGPTSTSLAPLDPALPHHWDGTIGGVVTVTVPNVGCLETAYIQMVAWNATVWGTDLANVPLTQLGQTDIVPFVLAGACTPLPSGGPRFTQSAIVPAIPEPTTWCSSRWESSGCRD